MGGQGFGSRKGNSNVDVPFSSFLQETAARLNARGTARTEKHVQRPRRVASGRDRQLRQAARHGH